MPKRVKDELAILGLMFTRSLHDMFGQYTKGKTTAKELGCSMLQNLDELVQRIAEMHGVEPEILYKAMRQACTDDASDDPDDPGNHKGEFGLGGDWWKGD